MTENERALELENYKLRLQLACVTGGVEKVISEALADHQRQQAVIDSLSDAIDRYILAIDQDLALAQQGYKESEERFEQILHEAQEGRLAEGRLGLLVHNAMKEQLDDEDKARRGVVGLINSSQIPIGDVGQSELARLLYASQKQRYSAILDFGTRAAFHAAALSGTPETTCAIILHELRNSKQVSVSIRFLEQLEESGWLKEKLPTAPKLSKMKEYLELAERQRRSNKSVILFAHDEKIPQRSVERALTFYDDFLRIAGS